MRKEGKTEESFKKCKARREKDSEILEEVMWMFEDLSKKFEDLLCILKKKKKQYSYYKGR
jgi:hypothetical protein